MAKRNASRLQSSKRSQKHRRHGESLTSQRRLQLGQFETLEERRLLTAVVLNGVANTANTYVLVMDLTVANQLDYQINAGPVQFAALSATPAANTITINGAGNSNAATIGEQNGVNGLIPATITFLGGPGVPNSLTFAQSGNVVATSDTYTVGPAVGQGQSVIVGNTTQTVNFSGLSPVFDNVLATTATVNATPANNAINYSQGPGRGIFVGNTGFVTVDNQESYEFNNKTNLVINALAGDDKISLDNPTTPAGLTGSITVNGGDPTASDTLVVNGIAGTTDAFIVDALTAGGGGTVFDFKANASAQIQPKVVFSNIESMNVVGQDADSDVLDETGTTGDDTFIVDPGVTADSGVLSGYAATFSFVPINYSGIAGFVGPSSSVTGNSPGVSVSASGMTGLGGNDTVIVDGTSVNDTFNWSNANLFNDISVNAGGVIHTQIMLANFLQVANVAHVIYRGLDGNDTFNVGARNFAGFDIAVQGNDSSGDPDVINYTPAPAAAIAANLATAGNSQSLTATGTPTVSFADIGIVNIDGVSGASTLAVTGTGPNSTLTYTPLVNSLVGSFQTSAAPTVYTFTHITTVQATSPGQMNIDVAGATAALTLSKVAFGSQFAGTLGIGPITPWQFTGATGTTVTGGNGDDFLTVDFTTSNPIQGILQYLAGNGGFNTLSLMGGAEVAEIYTPGPAPGAGEILIDAGTASVIDFKNLAPVSDSVPGPAVVNGTPASNAINYGPAVINTPSTWGRVAVDNFESYEFTNKTSLTINAEEGDDVINLNNPNTPTGLTAITVNGQDPTASDKLIVNGIAGMTDHFVVSSLNGVGAGQIIDANTAFANLQPPVTYTGIEAIDLVGQNADSDTLSESGTTGNDTFTIDPGADSASGLLSGFGPAFAFAPISYSGITGRVAASSGVIDFTAGFFFFSTGVGGTDTVIIDGTSADDTFNWDATLAAPQVRVDTGGIIHSPIALIDFNPVGAVAHVIYRGLDGNDTFNVAPELSPGTDPFDIAIQGNDSDPDPDVINYSAAIGAAIVATLATAGNSQSLTATNTPPVSFTGVEVVNIDGVGGANSLTVNGTGNDDTLSYAPTGVSAGFFANSSGPTQFNFSNIVGFFTFAEPSGASNTLLLDGTTGRDLFVLHADTRTAQLTPATGVAWKTVTLGPMVQNLTALGGSGEDTFQVTPSAGTQFGAANLDNLVINVDGGGSDTQLDKLGTRLGVNPGNNSLLVWNNGGNLFANQFAVVNQTSANSGNVRIYTAAVQWPDINYLNIATVTPFAAVVAGQRHLLIMGPDPEELNNSPPLPPVAGPLSQDNLVVATDLGSGPTIHVQNLTIFPNNAEFPGNPQDYDLFRVEAQVTGTIDFQAAFNLFDPALLPQGGNLNVEGFDAAGNRIALAAGGAAAFGAEGATGDARIRIPAVQGQTYYFLIYGSFVNGASPNPAVVNGYDLTIINSAPAIPYDGELSRSVAPGIAGAPDTGDLPPTAVNNDSGRSQLDDTTFFNKPTVYFRLADGTFLNDLPGNGTTNNPPAGVIPIPFQAGAGVAGYRVAIFDGNNAQTPVGFATAVGPLFPGLYQYTFTTALADGIHHIIAKVQMVDPAVFQETGFGDLSASLDITVDTVPPPVFFGFPTVGGDGLSPESDSGTLASGSEATLTDRITNSTTPFFWGTAEANSIIRVYDDLNGNGVVDPTDLLLAMTVAVPNDGTNAFPGGQWKVQSNINLNDPKYFAVRDGLRNILVTGEDLAGNVSPSPDALKIFLDTQGPQIGTSPANPQNPPIFLTGFPNFNLFLDKADGTFATLTPTPISNSLTIDFVDLGLRDPADFPSDLALIASIAAAPGNIVLKGDANGIIPIQSVVVVNDPIVAGQPASAHIVVTFKNLTDQNNAQAQFGLLDDRYTLTVSDNLVDIAGNNLDGESNAQQPVGTPSFPSGDGVPGGAFVARFTIDSHLEIGTYGDGTANLDLNGNGTFDPTNTDFTNRDKSFVFGFTTDTLFSGVLHNPNAAPNNQFDKIGAYGFANGNYRWLLDTNGDGVADQYIVQPSTVVFSGINFSMNGTPFYINFNGNQTIGLYDGHGDFFIDINDNDRIDPNDIVITSQLIGQPIVGDFDGNGRVDLGVYNNNTGNLEFNLASSTGVLTGLKNYTMTAATQSINGLTTGDNVTPVAGDLNGDGITDIGLYVVGRTTQSDTHLGEWYFFTTTQIGGTLAAHTGVMTQDHQFSPYPIGRDIYYQFGNDFAKPLFGNFDPPPATDDANTVAAPQAFAQLGTTLYVSGDGSGDAFALSATDATHYTVTVNGTSQTVDTTVVSKVVFQSAGGNTSAVLSDSLNAFMASLSADNTVLSRSGFEVDVIGAATVHVYGNASATAKLADPAGGLLVATPSYSYITGSGTVVEAVYFGSTSATAGGSSDSAVLYLGANQSLVNTPSFAQVTGGTTTTANGFHNVTAIGAAGATAHFYLSGHDQFVGSKSYGYVQAAGGGLDVAMGFPAVYAYAASGGSDTAYLYAAAQGALVVNPTYSYLTGTGYQVLASGFGSVLGVASGTGTDQVFINAGAGQTVIMTPTYATLSGGGTSVQAIGFSSVAASATKGAGNTAYLYDSAGDDTLTASGSTATLVTPKVRNSATNFDAVDAVHSSGNDTANVGAVDFALSLNPGWTS